MHATFVFIRQVLYALVDPGRHLEQPPKTLSDLFSPLPHTVDRCDFFYSFGLLFYRYECWLPQVTGVARYFWRFFKVLYFTTFFGILKASRN